MSPGSLTHEAILAACEELVLADDVSLITAESIADQLGTSGDQIREFYPDRIALFSALHDRFGELADQQLLRRISALDEVNLESMVEAILGGYVDFITEHPAYLDFWVRGPKEPWLRELGRQRSEAIGRLFSLYLEESGIAVSHVPMWVAGLAIEVGDRLLESAFADSDEPSPGILGEGHKMMVAWLSCYLLDTDPSQAAAEQSPEQSAQQKLDPGNPST